MVFYRVKHKEFRIRMTFKFWKLVILKLMTIEKCLQNLKERDFHLDLKT